MHGNTVDICGSHVDSFGHTREGGDLLLKWSEGGEKHLTTLSPEVYKQVKAARSPSRDRLIGWGVGRDPKQTC